MLAWLRRMEYNIQIYSESRHGKHEEEDTMSRIEEFRQLIAAYEAETDALGKQRRSIAGLFGMGKTPADDPCHDRLDKAVGEMCARAAEEDSPEEAAALAEAVLRAEHGFDGYDYARLTMIALQRHALLLIPRLGPVEKAALAEWYLAIYPRRMRLPVQDQIVKALGGTGRK